MTDKELLELAAKAYGLPLGNGDGEYRYFEDGPLGPGMYGREGSAPLFWSSLDSDGDALRLAVRLHLLVGRNRRASTAQFYEMNGWATIEEEHEDANVATRRAITIAATYIGARTTDTGGEA